MPSPNNPNKMSDLNSFLKIYSAENLQILTFYFGKNLQILTFYEILWMRM